MNRKKIIRTIFLLLLAILSISSFVWESWSYSRMIHDLDETPFKIGIRNSLWGSARETWGIATAMKDSMSHLELTLERYQQDSNSYASVVAELRRSDEASIARLRELSRQITETLSSDLPRMSVEEKIDLSNLLSFIGDLVQAIKIGRLGQYDRKSLPFTTTLILQEQMCIITAGLDEIQSRNREESYILHRKNVVSRDESLLRQIILVCATLTAGIFALREIIKILKAKD